MGTTLGGDLRLRLNSLHRHQGMFTEHKHDKAQQELVRGEAGGVVELWTRLEVQRRGAKQLRVWVWE